MSQRGRKHRKHRTSPVRRETSLRALGLWLCNPGWLQRQRKWRSPREGRIIRSLVWQCFQQAPEERVSARQLSRQLGCSHTHVNRLKREFTANPEVQLRREQTWPPGNWTDLRLEREKRKD